MPPAGAPPDARTRADRPSPRPPNPAVEKFEEVTKKGAKKKDVSAPASTVARAFPRGGDRAARDRSSPEGLHRDSPGRQPLTARLTFPVPSPRPQAPKPAPQGAKPAGRRDRDRPRDGKREERRGACDRSELAPRPTPRVPARHLAAPRRKKGCAFSARPDPRSPRPLPAVSRETSTATLTDAHASPRHPSSRQAARRPAPAPARASPPPRTPRPPGPRPKSRRPTRRPRRRRRRPRPRRARDPEPPLRSRPSGAAEPPPRISSAEVARSLPRPR